MDTEAYGRELIDKAVAGDEAALMVLLADADDRVRAHLARKIPADLRSTVGVDDIMQEAQINACRHIAGFVPQGPDAFDRWLATIAIRCLRNAIKKQRAIKRGGRGLVLEQTAQASQGSCVVLLELLAAPVNTPSRCAASAEAERAVRDALAMLPEAYRMAVELVYIEGRSVAEAASEMGRTPRAVHNLCYKAKAHLRDLLESGSRFLSRSG